MTDIFRILVVIFLAMHGVGHVIWFLASWTSFRVGVRDGAWSLPGNVTIRSPLGKVTGIFALAALAIFVVAAITLLAGAGAWRAYAFGGIVVSFMSVAPWLRQSPGTTAYMAIIADLVLLLLLSVPLSVELTGGP